MRHNFDFDLNTLRSIAGGESILDLPKLNVSSLEEAGAFIKAYGFRYEDPSQQEKLWYYHRRAVVLLTERLKYPIEQLPKEVHDPKEIGDLRKLLLYVSQTSDKNRQKWSCAILRIIHVFVHTENDLFGAFSEEIQKQILAPLQDAVVHDGTSGRVLLKSLDDKASEEVELLGFEVKPFKTSSSAVIKLLAKSDALAMNVYDKLGVRFLTKNILDSFRVIRFLSENNLVSYPHIMPDQSSNNIYPVELFVQATQALKAQSKKTDAEQFLKDYLGQNIDRAKTFRKQNQFSAADYKFIKFISRKLIEVKDPTGATFSFFYPFEVQILDQYAHKETQSGPGEHQAYKERQHAAARQRLFPGEGAS